MKAREKKFLITDVISLDDNTPLTPVPSSKEPYILDSSEDDGIDVMSIVIPSSPSFVSPMPRCNMVHLDKKMKIDESSRCMMINCFSTRLDKELLCCSHSEYMLELYIQKSTVKGAGFGLFTSFALETGMAIPGLFVRGELVHLNDVHLDHHTLALGGGNYIDCDRFTGLSYFVNDYRGNVTGRPNTEIREMMGMDGKVQFLFITIDAVGAGEEIFIDYGDEYWKDHHGWDDAEFELFKKSCYFDLYKVTKKYFISGIC